MYRATLLLFALSAAAEAATIRAVGVLGNSGEAGEGLVRVTSMPLEHCASGAAVDGDWTLWLSGGDAINRVGLDGHLIERFPIGPAGSVVDSRTFAKLDGKLYFLGRRLFERRAAATGQASFSNSANGSVALFELPMASGSTARPMAVALPERKRGHVGYCLAAEPLKGRLVIAAEPKEAAEDLIGVYLVDPKAGTLRQAFTLKGASPAGVAVDAKREVIYVGGDLGLFVGGVTHQSVCAVTAVRPDGTRVSDAFPAACTKTPATPTQFRGVVSLAGGALWDTAWYGFIARLDLEGRGDPGRIVEWHHELDYPTQILGLLDEERGAETPRPQPLVIATPMPDAFYFAEWDRAGRQLRLVRRLGCLPILSSLGLSQDGWVTASTGRTQLWWRWEDPADAPPRKTDIHLAITPLFFRGEEALAIAAQYHLSNLGREPLKVTLFSRRPGDRNEARRVGKDVPLKRPVGLAVQAAPGKDSATLFATDEPTRRLWRMGLSLSSLQPSGEEWSSVPIEGTELRAPTDVAALTDGRLLVADGGRVLLLEPQGAAPPGRAGYRLGWELARWGERPDQRFGDHLRLAVDGAWMLVSDTDRHRLVWLDWTTRKVLGSDAASALGETDHAGADARHLAAPTFVSLRGTRAVVADAGNQRILKIVLEP